MEVNTASATETVDQIVNTLQHTELTVLLQAIATLILCVLVIKAIMRLYDKAAESFTHITPTILVILRHAVKFTLCFIAFMVLAGILGIPVTSFLALFSVAGLAVTLAIQGVLANLAGGILLLLNQPFAVGDFIEAQSCSGTVKAISFLNTRLLSPDGKIIYIPNSTLYTGNVVNYSANMNRRIELTVSASYNDAPEKVRKACLAAIAATPAILTDPAPIIHLENYGDSAITYTVLCWAAVKDFFDAKYALNENLYSAFASHGVTMTYPHLNIHMQQN